jgi:hypothetical protein
MLHIEIPLTHQPEVPKKKLEILPEQNSRYLAVVAIVGSCIRSKFDGSPRGENLSLPHHAWVPRREFHCTTFCNKILKSLYRGDMYRLVFSVHFFGLNIYIINFHTSIKSSDMV